jgi:hypothetical protein
MRRRVVYARAGRGNPNLGNCSYRDCDENLNGLTLWDIEAHYLHMDRWEFVVLPY